MSELIFRPRNMKKTGGGRVWLAVPPVYPDQGVNIRVGRDVFINHNCTLNEIGGIIIGDEVLIGPRVSLNHLRALGPEGRA